jgi:4a-hydroxytetrahydrobiopterin dehydratase
MTTTDGITPTQFLEAGGTEDWRVISEGACAFYPTGSFAGSTALVLAIAEIPGIEDHRPAVDIRSDGVTVRLLTRADDWWGPSGRDLDLARRIQAIAREQGLAADTTAIQSVLVVPGASDPAEVMPFWQAVLGYERRPDSVDEDLVDAHDRGPSFWFEGMREPRGDGGGAIHIAVWVPYEEAGARVAAALAAGGRMVRDDYAPMWWTLADAAGNEADIATVKQRD